MCCVTSPSEVRLAINVGTDALELVARIPSGPGPIADEKIAEVTAMVPPPVATFLLTSETTAATIAAHIRRTNPSTVQVTSHIDPAEVARLADMARYMRRVQVIHIEGLDALRLIPVYSPHVHAFLLDFGRPNAVIAELGGTGRCHDWTISAEFVKASARPVFLAGGLSAANVSDAIRQVRPFGVGLCSGVRTHGRLDAAKLRAFVCTVERADVDLVTS
jgi:phosphoribosylanthranilate isomerase